VHELDAARLEPWHVQLGAAPLQVVEREHPPRDIVPLQVQRQRRTDEAGAAGHENGRGRHFRATITNCLPTSRQSGGQRTKSRTRSGCCGMRLFVVYGTKRGIMVSIVYPQCSSSSAQLTWPERDHVVVEVQ